MKKVAILINAHAGAGLAKSHLREARRILWGWQIEPILPSSLEELEKACQALDPDRYEALIVVGGDGTFQKVLQALCKIPRGGKQIPLLPFPAGTANDLATELGIRPDWEQVQTLLDQRSVQAIDLIFVNDIPFVTLAGIGVGSQLTSEYNERRKNSWAFRTLARRMSSKIYVALSAKALVFGKDYTHDLQIQSPEFSKRVKTSAVFICNQSRLGGQLTVSNKTRNDDGLFHVTIAPKSNLTSLLQSLASLRNGVIPADFTQLPTERLTIRDVSRSKPRVTAAIK
ncbi:MAG: diacylglycerol kinase family protein [Oligoflexia bacterium]|nr:diacylglycerol kinase family protein [Oligoflexia bacterium]